MRADQGPDRSGCRGRELCPSGRTLPARELGSRVAQHQGQHRESAGVDELVVGPERDVITKKGRQFKGVGVAADPGELVCVIDAVAAGLVDIDECRHAQPQKSGPQHVFHGLPKAEVDGQ